MFCSQCGNDCAPGIRFCGHCGASVSNEMVFTSTLTVTKKEYLNKMCSPKAKSRQKAIRILGIISLSVQLILFVLSVLMWMYIVAAIKSISGSRVEISGPNPLSYEMFFLVCSVLFTWLGMRNKSTGWWVASLFSAVVVAVFGAGISLGTVAARIALMVMLIMHVAIVILQRRNVKEYKAYIAGNR